MTSLDDINLGSRGKCFSKCPLCGQVDSVSFRLSLIKSHLYCNDCGAKWSVHFKLGDFVGATLVEANKVGSGRDLLQKEFEPEYWRAMALKLTDNNEAKKAETIREIIREKEVIVKVRCSYCKHLVEETIGKCPNCGATL